MILKSKGKKKFSFLEWSGDVSVKGIDYKKGIAIYPNHAYYIMNVVDNISIAFSLLITIYDMQGKMAINF